MGMQLLRTTKRPEQKYDLAFVCYASNPDQAEIELTYNYGVSNYEIGTAYGHIALGVPDAKAACEKIRQAGGKITREAGPVAGGTAVIAFVPDPDAVPYTQLPPPTHFPPNDRCKSWREAL